MKLWVGLGNPGAKYAGNRHNIGFMALDRIAVDHSFGPWKKAFRGMVAEGRLGAEKVILLKPETFMNLSGESVQAAMTWHKITPADLTVLHDELDLAPGKLRLKQGGGHAGHNGLRSIHSHIGEAYGRVRLGIGHPGHKDAVAGYVLRDFAKADQDWLEDLMRGISEGAPYLADGDGAKFSNAVALRTAPPRPSTGTGAEAGSRAGSRAGTGTGAGTGKGTGAAAGSGDIKAGKLISPDKAQPNPSAARPPATEKPDPEKPSPDNRSALQKLADRFRG